MNYRPIGTMFQPIGMGVDPKKVLAELYGTVTGTSQGMGGSKCIFFSKRNTVFMVAMAIVGWSRFPLGADWLFADNISREMP